MFDPLFFCSSILGISKEKARISTCLGVLKPLLMGFGVRYGICKGFLPIKNKKVLDLQGLFVGGEGGNCVMYTTPDTACCKPIIPHFLKKQEILIDEIIPKRVGGGFGKESLQFDRTFSTRT